MENYLRNKIIPKWIHTKNDWFGMQAQNKNYNEIIIKKNLKTIVELC